VNDAFIYDGAGWQSIKGPPGPSAISSDAGNTLKLGGDGLLFTTAPPDSSAYVWCKQGDTPQARYDRAKTLTPNGAPLSATNRATLLVFPGTYAGTLTLSSEFVDVYGVGQLYQRPSVTLGSIVVNANDVRVSGVSSTGAFNIGTGGSSQVFENCTCFVTSAFGGGGVAAGTFTNCRGGNNSFGGSGTASGTFVNCTAATGGFGGNGTASGTFTNCRATNQCFGGGVSGVRVASGTFLNCTGSLYAFGGLGTVSGTFTNCLGNDESFGGNGVLTAAARLFLCRLGEGPGKFPVPLAGAVLRYCVDGTFAQVNIP
jgi:hypothetical protein